MRRTQVQLDPETYAAVRQCAFDSRRSISAVVRDTLSKKPYWSFLVQAVSELGGKAISALKSRS